MVKVAMTPLGLDLKDEGVRGALLAMLVGPSPVPLL